MLVVVPAAGDGAGRNAVGGATLAPPTNDGVGVGDVVLLGVEPELWLPMDNEGAVKSATAGDGPAVGDKCIGDTEPDGDSDNELRSRVESVRRRATSAAARFC